MSNVAGVILAGGLSRRMEGNEKTLMALAGKPLVHHVFDRLSQQISPILLNANADPERFSFLDIPIQADSIDGYAGPLAGVLTGMSWTKTLEGIEWIVTAAADTPFFPDDYVKQMIEAVGKNKIVLAASNGRRHPVFGLWHISLAEDLEEFLNAGDRKVMLFVQRYANALVDFEADGHDPFFNVNTPEDWGEAKFRAAEIFSNE